LKGEAGISAQKKGMWNRRKKKNSKKKKGEGETGGETKEHPVAALKQPNGEKWWKFKVRDSQENKG